MRSTRSHRDDGFVLIVVLLSIVALGAISAGFTASLTAHLRETSAVTAEAEAEALADAGVELVILDLVNARLASDGPRRFPTGESTRCEVTPGTITVQISEESGKIDINVAGDDLLRALLIGLGHDPASARAMADAILDYRDGDDIARASGAEASQYRAAGRSIGPKNAPFESVHELGQVLGLDGATVARLRPFVTVHSGLPAITPEAASPVLIRMLLSGAGHPAPEAESFADMRASLRRLLPAAVTASPSRAIAVRAIAETGTAVFVREAVVVLEASRSRPYAIRAWRQGTVENDQTPIRSIGRC